jgi:hypothetical protein
VCKPHQAIINAHLVEAYAIMPFAFFQDGYWGSGVSWSESTRARRFGDSALEGLVHRPFSLLCIEQGNNELALVVTQTSIQTDYAARAFNPDESNSCFDSPDPYRSENSWPAKLLVISDLLAIHSIQETWVWLVYRTKQSEIHWKGEGMHEGGSEVWINVGQWNQGCGFTGVVLRIDSRSSCFDSLELGHCSIEVEGQLASGGIISEIFELSSMLHIHRDIFCEYDILDPAFRPRNLFGALSSFITFDSSMDSNASETNPISVSNDIPNNTLDFAVQVGDN